MTPRGVGGTMSTIFRRILRLVLDWMRRRI